MANSSTKQKIANLMNAYDAVVEAARTMYDDKDVRDWAIGKSNQAHSDWNDCNEKLKSLFSIDYKSDDAKNKLIKVGSKVEVLVNHMDGMKMPDHKWLTKIVQKCGG